MSNEQIVKIKELNPDIIAPSTKRMNIPDQGGSKTIVVGKPGCFAPGTEILKYDGTIVNVEDVKVGDILMGDNSSPRNVLELCHNFDEMFEVVPVFGEKYTVNKMHKLVLINLKPWNKKEVIEITVEDYLNKPTTWQKQWGVFRNSVEFEWQPIDIEPYLLGLWLGNEILNSSNMNNENLTKLENMLNNNEQRIIFFEDKKLTLDNFLSILKDNNLIENKYIPYKYKSNTRELRVKLLTGIIDSCGTYDNRDNSYEIIQSSKELINDIAFVARTLGLVATVKEIIKSNECMQLKTFYKVILSGSVSIIFSYIKKNILLNRTYERSNLNSRFYIRSKGHGEYYGFTIDQNHRFLLASCDVVRNTGKTTLIASLLYSKRHIFPVGMVMSGSEDSNGFYRKIFPSTFVYNDYNEDRIKDFIRRQKIAKQHLPNPWAVILLDDCTDDPRIFNKPLQHGMYKRGRHWKMWYILSLQYAMDVKPVIRTNVDGIFILREPILKNRKTLWENYCSVIPDFNLFCEIMDQLTDDYTALYIQNAAQSNDWTECVFWYKAMIVPKDFKFGCPEFWTFHNARYNPEYVDPFTC